MVSVLFPSQLNHPGITCPGRAEVCLPGEANQRKSTRRVDTADGHTGGGSKGMAHRWERQRSREGWQLLRSLLENNVAEAVKAQACGEGLERWLRDKERALAG